jgi:hypothetical protein
MAGTTFDVGEGRMRAKRTCLLVIIFIGAAISACNFSFEPVDAAEPDAQSTLAHETVVARLTEIAASFTQTPLPETPTSSAIPATETPTATVTSLPTSTATPVPCDRAGFVADVTIADGTVLHPGEEFTKTWRLKNDGVCTWTTDYDLVFVRGDRMGAVEALALSDTVNPGQTLDLKVKMVGPEKKGSYTGYWMLRNGSGRLFGLGPRADQVFWVSVKVEQVKTTVAYKFVSHFCEAEWRSGAGTLSCPGTEGDTVGFVVKLESPSVEGRDENEPTLLTHPEWVGDGWISGRFPGIDIKEGDRFATVIGCMDEAPSCNVKFQLDYEGGDGFVHTLGSWHEVFDKKVRSVDIDLGDLAGKNVRFIFRVQANGSSDDDLAFWLNPRILRIKS